MIRRVGCLVLTLLTGLVAANEPAITPDRPLALWNGRDLAGWTTWLVDQQRADPRGVYSVRDGQLRISGDGLGYLATSAEYRDYRLVVEFRWGEKNFGERERKARDSGIFLHAVGPDGNSFDGNGAYRAAIECQVMEGAVGDLLLINGKYADGSRVPVRLAAEIAADRDAEGWATWLAGGKETTFDRGGRINWFGKEPKWEDRLGFRGPRDVERPAGEWNRGECLCRGATIEIVVNEKLVNRATDVFPAAGRILLQCEGSEIFFRRVELLPLAPLAPAQNRRE